MDHDNRKSWYLDKAISLPTIISLLMMFAGGVAYAVRDENRKTKLEQIALYLSDSDKAMQFRFEQERASDRQEIKDQLREIKDAILRLEQNKK